MHFDFFDTMYFVVSFCFAIPFGTGVCSVFIEVAVPLIRSPQFSKLCRCMSDFLPGRSAGIFFYPLEMDVASSQQ